ncbi:MAG: endonuclease V, partial [Planctomycetes bacterium]|nr:endonuclease V [Planctomycetota bacterium]
MSPRSAFDVRRAAALQREIAARVITRDRIGRRVRRIAGVDMSVAGDRCRAAVVVLDARTLEVLETRTADQDVTMPYIPGYLTFRELPAIRAAFRALSEPPDLVIVDGMGRIHPRRCGIAC